jgi:hypothetical protein
MAPFSGGGGIVGRKMCVVTVSIKFFSENFSFYEEFNGMLS